jgi:hypothetical protein
LKAGGTLKRVPTGSLSLQYFDRVNKNRIKCWALGRRKETVAKQWPANAAANSQMTRD